ncbi:hypothetical protein ACRALDRAFT_2021414 [Sodiomyces alcalophilus JCM 7366]|uniref:uncharacterized protein n=1 Tax=Sodiomyces alcalophilus JCM 7366 TaxID=591952 RepID=UPI0039B61924
MIVVKKRSRLPSIGGWLFSPFFRFAWFYPPSPWRGILSDWKIRSEIRTVSVLVRTVAANVQSMRIILPTRHRTETMGKKKRLPQSLSAGRPPTIRQRPLSISRRETRALINAHHTLQKKRQQAIARSDDATVSTIDAEIAALGGIENYQRASLQGQRNDRGGDSSRLLLKWLEPSRSQLTKAASSGQPFRMLEVGALSTRNACSNSGLFQMELIDLNSQQSGILQQDFMERPVAKSDEERFDIISLSLVLNYVPDAALRGRMLLRTLAFLREPPLELPENERKLFPSLFLVLPRSCVVNSRYISLARLTELMSLLGYIQVETRFTNKLAYFLWTRASAPKNPLPSFPKKEVNPGSNRNNFSIVLNTTT